MPKKQTKKSAKKVTKKNKKEETKPRKITEKKKSKTRKISEKKTPKEKYIEAIGRRKTSVARVRFYQEKEIKGMVIVNKKESNLYFPEKELENIIHNPIRKTNSDILKKGGIKIIVRGGGKRGQAEAVQLGIARLILLFDKNTKKILKANSLLTRDPRKKERKKFGLKKARKAPQWQKR